MSLNFDLKVIPLETRTVIADRDAGPMEGDWKAGDRIMNPITNGLIWACLAVGLRGIDEKNVDEFCFRMAFYQRFNGAWFRFNGPDGIEDKPITSEDIRAHMGLTTNVSPEKRAAWLKRIADSFDRDRIYVERRRAEQDAEAIAA